MRTYVTCRVRFISHNARSEFLARTARMVIAHWTKGLTWAEVECWYDAHIERYAYVTLGSKKPNYIQQREFILEDAMRMAERHLDMTPENGYD